MTYFNNETQTLYLKSWEYNACLIFTELAKIVANNGGRVKKQNCGYIVNRTLLEDIAKKEERLEAITRKGFPADSLSVEIESLKQIKNDPVKISNSTYISFVLDNIYYYYQVDNNPFFEFYYIKTPVVDGKRSKDACLEYDKKNWLFDCFFGYCDPADIKEAANLIFNMLLSANNSIIERDKTRRRVANTYNSGYHYETIYSPERKEAVDF